MRILVTRTGAGILGLYATTEGLRPTDPETLMPYGGEEAQAASTEQANGTAACTPCVVHEAAGNL